MLKIRSLYKSFNKGKTNEISVLKDVSLSFPNAGLFIILGPSGSGKSTLLSLIGALDSPDSGDIFYDDTNIVKLSNKEKDKYHQEIVSFIFQEHNLVDYLSLKDNATLKIKDNTSYESVLKELDVFDLLNKNPATLSGGEKERCAIARAILSDSKILLCDEPTASLDSENARNVLAILKKASQEKLVIVVSHDEKLCREFSDNIIEIRDGVVKQNEIDTEQNKNNSLSNKNNKVYKRGILKKSLYHAKHKYKEASLIVFLSMVAFFCVSVIVGLANGTKELVDKSMNDLIHFTPLTVSSYYENITSVFLLNDTDESNYTSGINIDQKTEITESLHKNIITEEFASYLTSDPIEKTYFSYNNDQSYSVIYEDNGSYRLLDEQSVESLNDYIDSFFGKRSTIKELVYDKDYFMNNYDWLGGHFPENDNEAVLVYHTHHLVNENIAKILNVKDGDDPMSVIGKKIYIGNHNDLYGVNDTKAVTGHFLKDNETLKKEGRDVRALSNYAVQFVNDYYEGNVDGQKDAREKIDGLFKEEVETRTINAYTKMQNSSSLREMIDNNKAETITISGVAMISKTDTFADKNDGILIPSAKLRAIRHNNSSSAVAKEIDSHIVMFDSSSMFNVPHIYGYINNANDKTSGSIEDYLVAYIDFFENRKFFSVNDEISSIEVYAPNVKAKDYYVDKIEKFNADKVDSSQIKYLDFSKRLVKYFDSYFSLVENVLYTISIVTLVVSSILSMAIIFNMVSSRVKEIGILRACGYSRLYVFSLIEVENLLFGLLSGVIGVTIAFIVSPLICHNLSLSDSTIDLTHIIHISPIWAIIIMVLAVVVAFLSALVPSIIYSRKNTSEILKS